ncbi:MAG: hypothetical protein AAGG51_21115 [Cyanobacteria bacterium P01_G01_bin.54]
MMLLPAAAFEPVLWLSCGCDAVSILLGNGEAMGRSPTTHWVH